MTRNGKKIARHILWALVLGTVFFAGWHARGTSHFQQGFEIGYEAASNQISSRIRSGMHEMQPFYIADIGIRFYPRDLLSARMKYIGSEPIIAAKAEATE